MSTEYKDRNGDQEIVENPIISELLFKGATNSKTFSGYVGRSEKDTHLLVYKSLWDLSNCVEIAKDDILHHVKAPAAFLPFGGIIFFLRKDAKVISHRVIGTTGVVGQTAVSNSVEKRIGRLIMRLGTIVSEDCTSNCDCQSQCDCQSHCSSSIFENQK